MTKNPYLNALLATGYISLIASMMFFLNHNKVSNDNTVFAPIAFISVFSLSAAMMGYIFLANPLMLYLDGKKKEAVNLFVKTLGTFALLTALSLTYLFFT